MSAAVLDSHALLAFFRGEEGAALVKELLHKAASADRPLQMTEVNYAEVKYIVVRKDAGTRCRTSPRSVSGHSKPATSGRFKTSHFER